VEGYQCLESQQIPSRHFQEARMEWAIVEYQLSAAAIFVLGVVLLGYRVIRAIRVHISFRGTRLLTCPDTHMTAVVGVAAKSMGMQAILDEPCRRFSECSRWPMRRGCGRECLRQIEARPSELRLSATSSCN
jgi:hypothetical protein